MRDEDEIEKLGVDKKDPIEERAKELEKTGMPIDEARDKAAKEKSK